MPTNKNATIRYRVLDRCFRNSGRRFYIQDLIKACSDALCEIGLEGVSRRTVLNDIAYMESEAGWGNKGIEILRLKDEDGKRVYYRYADARFSIDGTPLTVEELLQLRAGIELLAQFKGHTLFENMDSILSKLDNFAQPESTPIIEFSYNPYLNGVEYADVLYQAIKNRQVLRVTYQSFKWIEPKDIIFHPHYLRQYNNRWFVFGRNEDLPELVWNIAIDRIIQLHVSSNKQYVESNTNWNEYFSDIIGVTNPNDAEVETIVLHCFGNSGKYISNKPIHESQRHKWLTPDRLEVRLRLKLNYELESFILGRGEEIEVIAPQHLRDRIMFRLQAAGKLYND